MTENYAMHLMRSERAIIGPSSWVLVTAQRLDDHYPYDIHGWREEQLDFAAKQHAFSCLVDPSIFWMTKKEMVAIAIAEVEAEIGDTPPCS